MNTHSQGVGAAVGIIPGPEAVDRRLELEGWVEEAASSSSNHLVGREME